MLMRALLPPDVTAPPPDLSRCSSLEPESSHGWWYLAGAAVSPARCDPAEGVAERTKGDGRAMPPPLSGPPISKADYRGVLAAILAASPTPCAAQ